ncbi:MAG: phosphoenolpyruvate synthase [Candidatus Syntropharchaeales archaeon]
MLEKSVVWLQDVGSSDLRLVGGKGASLGEMMSIGLPVPPSFAVTAMAFRAFIDDTGIADRLFKALEIDVNDTRVLKEAENAAKELILMTEMPSKLKEKILDYYDTMCKNEGEEVYVAVRSSATAEDLPDASFAGQQDTFLNIKGGEAVIDAVKRCWASLYNSRAIFYRIEHNFNHREVDISVVIQKMVDSKKAGVMFTRDPSTGAMTSIIEASWGLGEAIVSGSVSPDHYVVDRSSKKIINQMIPTKDKMYIRDPETRETVVVPVPQGMRDARVLTDGEIMKLVEFGEIVEDHYGIAQDAEWGIDEAGKIYMLQSRPITTIKDVSEPSESSEPVEEEIILVGLGAAPGIATGKVKIVRKIDELPKVEEGDIMVTKMTTPDMVPAMKRAAAIVTDEGGLTCHAAIVSRELSTPAVVGTKKATSLLKDKMIITVDGEKGKIYRGSLIKEKVHEEVKVSPVSYRHITATEVKVNISIPEAAEKAAATGADGVGLLRIEHMILGLNKHPSLYIAEGKEDEYINELVKGIKTVADAFYPKPVWVRTLDAPTDEFRSMKGGDDEPIEHNPMLGWRGIRRDLTYTEHFKLELGAFKKLFELGYRNVGIMLPLVQHPSEVKRAKQIMEEVGLDLETTTLGIMIETPAAAIIIEEFLDVGLDFVSFGTNDLTQYTLAIDRNNEHVASLYNERHPAVMKLIEYVIGVCRERGVITSICGQAGSKPEIVKKLVEFGISSISANIDAVDAVRHTVAIEEQKLIVELVRSNRGLIDK